MRDILKVYGPAILILVIAGIIGWQFILPAPPKVLRIAAGSEKGMYWSYAQRYAALLAPDGITLEIEKTEGSAENLARLSGHKVDLALVQGGVGDPDPNAHVEGLARVGLEPVWLILRRDLKVKRLSELKGMRVAGGMPGSGSAVMVERLLAANRLEESDLHLLAMSMSEAAAAIREGKADAALAVSAEPPPEVVALLREGKARLFNFAQHDAYTHILPYLTAVTLPAGSLDLPSDLPAEDTSLLATSTRLLVRDDFPSALVEPVLEAVWRVHHSRSRFSPPGTFPDGSDLEFPLNEGAQNYFEHGTSLLSRILPFQAVVWVHRLWIIVLPLLTLAIPVIRLAPPAYDWQVRRRVYRWYRELARLEFDQSLSAQETLRRLDALQTQVARVKVPLSYADRLFSLRQHIDDVRRRRG